MDKHQRPVAPSGFLPRKSSGTARVAMDGNPSVLYLLKT